MLLSPQKPLEAIREKHGKGAPPCPPGRSGLRLLQEGKCQISENTLLRRLWAEPFFFLGISLTNIVSRLRDDLSLTTQGRRRRQN